jgi:hypothetical protein
MRVDIDMATIAVQSTSGSGPTTLSLKAHDVYENGVVHLSYGPA